MKGKHVGYEADSWLSVVMDKWTYEALGHGQLCNTLVVSIKGSSL